MLRQLLRHALRLFPELRFPRSFRVRRADRQSALHFSVFHTLKGLRSPSNLPMLTTNYFFAFTLPVQIPGSSREWTPDCKTVPSELYA